jgi:hypothetical protein
VIPVGHHVRDTIKLHHHAQRHGSWSGSWRSAVIDDRDGASFGDRAEVESCVIGQEKNVGECPGLEKLWEDMLDRGLTLEHAIGDAVHLVNIWGLGPFGIDASLERGELLAIHSTAHRVYVNQSVPHGIPAGGIGVEDNTHGICKSPTVLRHGVCRVGRWPHHSSASPHP